MLDPPLGHSDRGWWASLAWSRSAWALARPFRMRRRGSRSQRPLQGRRFVVEELARRWRDNAGSPDFRTTMIESVPDETLTTRSAGPNPSRARSNAPTTRERARPRPNQTMLGYQVAPTLADAATHSRHVASLDTLPALVQSLAVIQGCPALSRSCHAAFGWHRSEQPPRAPKDPPS